MRSVAHQLYGGRQKLLLNLGDVSYIDSSGIGELVSAYTTVRREGGDMPRRPQTRLISRAG